MNNVQITYVFCPICDKYIARALYTLYKFSEPGTFRVIVIDQCKDGFSPEVMKYVKPLIHLYMHPIRNLGFAKAMNEGIIHGLHWKTPYICIANDDIEIMNKRWLQGVWDTFAMDPQRIMGVVPMCPRVAGWGYGVDYNPEVLPYKEEYTEEDYDFLLSGDFSKVTAKLPDTYPRMGIRGTVVDGAAFIMVYFKRECFEKIGLLDERFFPGSGEDYDMLARIYKEDLRLVSTSYSWIWHHWTKSKDLFGSGYLEDSYYKPKDHPYWVNLGDLWPEGHDVWGHKTDVNGKKIPLKRVDEIFTDQI